MARVGIVGAGFMASHYLRMLNHRKGWEVAGIVSRTPESASKLAERIGQVPVFPNISDMYRNARPQVVIVAVPELETFGVMQQVWEYPWISLVEKPVGYNFEQAQLLAEQCRDGSRTSFVALNRRFYESTTRAREMVGQESGVRFVAVVDQHDTISAQIAGQPADVVQNWHFANAIHTVDLLRQFARGTVSSVDTKIWESTQNRRFVDARIEFSGGDVASYQSYWNSPNTWSLSCATADLRVLLSPLERVSFHRKDERTLTRIPLTGPDQDSKPGLEGLLSEIEVHLSGEKSDLPSLDDALESMSLVEKIYGSSQ